MNNKSNERLWRVRNIQSGVLLLPFPPLSHPLMEILPINGTAVIEQDLLEALGDVIEIIEEVVPTSRSNSGLKAATSVSAPTNSDKCEKDLNFRRFFQLWSGAFGKTFRRTSELLPLADKANLELLDSSKQQHQRVSNLGKSLRRRAVLDNRPWIIKTRRRSNRTEYSLCLIQNPGSENGTNPLI